MCHKNILCCVKKLSNLLNWNEIIKELCKGPSKKRTSQSYSHVQKKLKFAMKIMSNVSQKDFILCCVKDFQFVGLEWNNEGIV